MFKALILILPITEFVDSFRFGLFELIIVSTLRFFGFFWFSIFPGYHYVGGRGVLKVETKKWQFQGQLSSPLDSCLVKTNASCTRLSILNALCVHAKGVY